MNVTDDRQTTDGQATAFSEREREFTKLKTEADFKYLVAWH